MGLLRFFIYKKQKFFVRFSKKEGCKFLPFCYYIIKCTPFPEAEKRKVDGLVLISPFASLSRLVAEKYPFSNWILKDDYPSEKTIQKLTAPIIIIHGTADTLVPVHHAKILYEQRKNNAELYLLDEKGHREVFWAEETPTLISNWLKSLKLENVQ